MGRRVRRIGHIMCMRADRSRILPGRERASEFSDASDERECCHRPCAFRPLHPAAANALDPHRTSRLPLANQTSRRKST